MKKNILVISLLLIVLLLTGCTKETVGKDAKKFKEDYEALNGVTIKDDIKHRSITIPEKNPIEYKTFEEISKMIDDKESFVLYVGFSACPWCRSVIPYVLEVAKEKKINTIYYVNVRSDNTKATDLRGYYKLDKDNKPVVDIPADPNYYKGVKEGWTLLVTAMKIDNVVVVPGKRTRQEMIDRLSAEFWNEYKDYEFRFLDGTVISKNSTKLIR